MKEIDITNPWIGIGIGLACVLAVQVFIPFQPFDDAYITYRYARNISEGAGFVYNLGERILGTTTPLFTMILALIAVMTKPDTIPGTSQIISIVADGISLWLLFCIVKDLFHSDEVAFLAALVFLLQPFRLSVANGGMETSLFITCLLFTYYLYIHGERSLSTSVWAALTFLIRPDALLALIPIYLDWFMRDRRSFIKAALLALLLVSPWLIWATYYFGLPIPQSVVAKNLAYKNPAGHALFFLFTFIGTGTQGPYASPLVSLPMALIALPILILGPIVLYKNQPKALIIGSYPVIYTIVMSLVNPSLIFAWYFLPLIPGLIILILGIIWYGLRLGARTKLAIASAISLILILIPAYLIQKYPSSLLSRAREAAFWEACEFLLEYDMADKTVLAPDIGVVGWCLEGVKILDPIGLVSPESLPYLETLPSKELVSLELVKNQQPDYILTLDHFLTPSILADSLETNRYKLLYENQVDIAGDMHGLYIFQLVDSDTLLESD